MELKINYLIFKQKNIVNKNDCTFLIDVFEKHINLSSTEGSFKYIEGKNPHPEIDNFKCLNLSLNTEIKEIEKALEIASNYIFLMVKKYHAFLKENISLVIPIDWMNSTSNIRILKYSVGEQIKDHLDVSLVNRVSCTLNLNENYEGGEFTFFSGKHIETFKTGDAMIFPAEHIWIHGTKPITKGTRYSINCFLKNKLYGDQK